MYLKIKYDTTIINKWNTEDAHFSHDVEEVKGEVNRNVFHDSEFIVWVDQPRSSYITNYEVIIDVVKFNTCPKQIKDSMNSFYISMVKVAISRVSKSKVKDYLAKL